jgi:hypothetical protein
MAENTDLLNQIRQVVREENEPIKKRLDEQGRVIAQVKTGVEALAAGQSEIKETIATKADVMDLGAKIDKVTKNHETRIRELEEDRGIHHRNKN